MTENKQYKNAVLDDKELQGALKTLNPKFGDFVTRVAGEAWGLPLLSQKTKALITIAVDVANQNLTGLGSAFGAHVDMALKQGATREEIEELLLFLCVYSGFNKVASAFGALNAFFAQRSLQPGIAPMRVMENDFAARDAKGKVAFYALLWKRKGISSELFSEYWRNVNGPIAARLPGQYQYWQFHLDASQGSLWPKLEGIQYNSKEASEIDGIAEVTFATEEDRQAYFKSADILNDDGQHLFSKAVGYTTSPGHSKTYIDGIETGDPNGALNVLKFQVLVKKADDVSLEAFRHYMTNSFAPAVVQNDSVLKFRLHLFDPRPHAPGDPHYEAPEKQYQAAFEIAFTNHLGMEKFFASPEYNQAVKEQAKYVKQINAFPERAAYTFVYGGKMTLAGQRSSKVAELITKTGAINQLREDVVSLMSGNQQNGKSGLGHYLQGVQHFGITVYDMAKAMEFYTGVLGGKVAIQGDGFVGEDLHNLLFQKEEIEALEKGVSPRLLGVPDVRDGSQESLDVRFISFGNTCVEVIHFRDAKLNPNAPNIFAKVPSSVGYANVPHLSFHVKDDVDLNEFAKMLEAECQKRGLTDVVVNKVIHVNSEQERRKAGSYYAKTEFPGDFNGWALFYCKGPNGEQLEFNQVSRVAQANFRRAQKEYNEAQGTNFPWASDTVNGSKSMMTTATKWDWPHTKKWPGFSGSKIDILKQLFLAGEAMNINNFIQFLTEDCVYQFGNFPIAYGHEAIKEASVGFLEKCEGLHHHIKSMWQPSEDVVLIEMDVTYVRHDGKVFTLPCADTVRFRGDKISELRIYMDINPMFTE